jgi:hypothetical protein
MSRRQRKAAPRKTTVLEPEQAPAVPSQPPREAAGPAGSDGAGPIPAPEAVVAAVAAAVILGLILAAYFTERGGGVDELALYNPTYMAVNFGKMTFPVHGYFDRMVIQPPVHYWLVAAAMFLGAPLYYAQATPTFAMSLLCIILIVRSPLPAAYRLGLLLALYAPVGLYGARGIELFGMRPEYHLTAAWLAGLVALESGRRREWNVARLFAGAFLLTYASGLNYFAGPAFLGIGVYAAGALRQLGWAGARRALLALAAGGSLFGIPFLLLFVIPGRELILPLIRSAEGFGGIASAVAIHLERYRWMATGVDGFWLPKIFRIGVPLMAFSIPALLALRPARMLVLASLPWQLFILFILSRKNVAYLMPELTMLCAALFCGAVALAEYFSSRLRPRRLAPVLAPGVTALLLLFILGEKVKASPAVLSTRARVHEAELARAAGIEMMGPGARVGGRLGIWYACGAAHWYGIAPDLLYYPIKFDLREYFSRFDVFAEHPHMSDATWNDRQATLSSWYADGQLHLAGFYFAQIDADFSYVLLSARPPETLTGFGLINDQLYRFVESGTGEHTVLELACPAGGAIALRKRAPLSATLYLPPSGASPSPSTVLTAIVPAAEAQSNFATASGCRELRRHTGALLLADRGQLVAGLRLRDRPMRFYQRLEDLPAARSRPTESGRGGGFW